MSIGPYLYRGTTAGWPGNIVLREKHITCTSTDPLVATLFAIECRNHGRAVILAAVRRDDFLDLTAPENYFCEIESAVNLYIPPREFAAKAEVIVDVDTALAILSEIGFNDLPVRIRNKEMLTDAIQDTYEARQRLNFEQLELFNARMLGVDL